MCISSLPEFKEKQINMNLLDTIPFSSLIKNIEDANGYGLIMGYDGYLNDTVMLNHSTIKGRLSPVYFGKYHLQLLDYEHNKVIDNCVLNIVQSNKYSMPLLKIGALKEDIIRFEKDRNSKIEINDTVIVAKILDSNITMNYFYINGMYFVHVILPQFSNGFIGNSLLQGIPIHYENREGKHGMFSLVYNDQESKKYDNKYNTIMIWDNEFLPLDLLGKDWINMPLISEEGTVLMFYPIMFFPELTREYAGYRKEMFDSKVFPTISYFSLDSIPFNLIRTDVCKVNNDSEL